MEDVIQFVRRGDEEAAASARHVRPPRVPLVRRALAFIGMMAMGGVPAVILLAIVFGYTWAILTTLVLIATTAFIFVLACAMQPAWCEQRTRRRGERRETEEGVRW